MLKGVFSADETAKIPGGNFVRIFGQRPAPPEPAARNSGSTPEYVPLTASGRESFA
jgi:hypothetical protein